MKNQNGITLVALIITVVLMLILANVSVSLIDNEDSLIQHTKVAGNNYNEAALEEDEYLEQIRIQWNEMNPTTTQ